jgi:anti-sigma factor ChrR (cupin superfamily)
MDESADELEPALAALALDSTPRPPAPRMRRLLLDLAEAPRLPLDLRALAWEETGPGLMRAIVRQDPERNMTGAILWARPGVLYPRHRHRGEEGFLVLQGHCRDETAEYRVGSVALKGPGSVHTVEFLPGEDCIGYVVTYGAPEPVE